MNKMVLEQHPMDGGDQAAQKTIAQAQEAERLAKIALERSDPQLIAQARARIVQTKRDLLDIRQQYGKHPEDEAISRNPLADMIETAVQDMEAFEASLEGPKQVR